jgi:hypothetical protein
MVNMFFFIKPVLFLVVAGPPTQFTSEMTAEVVSAINITIESSQGDFGTWLCDL